MNDIYATIAKGWPVIAETERREAEQLQRWVVETAEDAMKSDEVSDKYKELVAYWLKEFQACFNYVVNGSAGKTASLGMLEAATIIFAIAPMDSEAKRRIASSALYAFRREGGNQRGKDERYDSWKEWREKAMIDTKAMLRANPHIKRAEILRRLMKLNPTRHKRTLESNIDHWKKRGQRLQKILRR